MDPAAPNPLLRSFERHLRAENRSDQTVTTYLIALRQAEAFLTATRGTTLAQAGRADWRPTWATPRRWPRSTGCKSSPRWSAASSGIQTCVTSPPDQSTYLLSPW
jgi:hypothetical protein